MDSRLRVVRTVAISMLLAAAGTAGCTRNPATGKRKLIYDAHSRRHALYDLASDPQEQRDLLVGVEPPADLKQALDDWTFAMKQHRPPVAAPDPAIIEAMRSLGYIQ